MIFGIRGNTAKAELAMIVHRLVKGLDLAGINYICEAEIAAQIRRQFSHKLRSQQVASEKELVKKCDFMISIGGDGTFLATAKLVGNRDIPIIGVNL
ncbi:MAG TPA: NAD(+)/NADH kinase, partial [Ignavibacteria bacterium]|nr:NAD(+)/NADH kinase [Ignavibacteria bacterium]